MLFFLTLRCSPLECQLFEDITTLILQEITQFISHTYCVEKDNSPDRHLHLLVKTNHRDLSHFKQVFKKKKYEPFFKLINSRNTETNQHALDIQTIKEEDYNLTLGYIYKETFCNRRSTSHTTEEVQNAIEEYYAHKRLETQFTPATKKIILTVKNFHSHIEKFLQENPEESVIDWYSLKKKMILNNYSFFDISEKKVRIAINELQMIATKDSQKPIGQMITEDIQESKIINEHYEPDYYDNFCPVELKVAYKEHNKWCHSNKKKTDLYLYSET